ncbi:DUF1080 domain-containing protein [Candidatus Sumerlaeota bacterium]|nr:DUF1080 domain-containing protein [Candidatus Sumerlaeota bacterium]
MMRRAAMAMALLAAFVLLTIPSGAASEETGWAELFNGKDLSGWTAMNEGKFEVRDKLLCVGGGTGWLRSDQLYDDFVLEFEVRPLKDNFDSGVFFRAGLGGKPWPEKNYCVNLRSNQWGALLADGERLTKTKQAAAPVGQWTKWVLTVEGKKGSLLMDGKTVWETDELEPGRGLVGIQAENSEFEFRNIRIKEVGHLNLLTGEAPTGSHFTTIVGAKGVWTLRPDGVLECRNKPGQATGGWIGTKTDDWANFDLKLEFNVPPDGNSGVFIRRPIKGDGAYEGMEIQVIDDDAKVFGKLQPWQHCGSIYREVVPAVRATRKAGTWQSMEIVADKNIVRVCINGVEIVNADLDKYTTATTRAKALKDRPRQGYIGLQNHGSGIEYRNIRVKRLPD